MMILEKLGVWLMGVWEKLTKLYPPQNILETQQENHQVVDEPVCEQYSVKQHIVDLNSKIIDLAINPDVYLNTNKHIGEVRVYEPNHKKLHSIAREIEILKNGLTYSIYSNGMVLINRKVVLALFSGKWRMLDSSKWHVPYESMASMKKYQFS